MHHPLTKNKFSQGFYSLSLSLSQVYLYFNDGIITGGGIFYNERKKFLLTHKKKSNKKQKICNNHNDTVDLREFIPWCEQFFSRDGVHKQMKCY